MIERSGPALILKPCTFRQVEADAFRSPEDGNPEEEAKGRGGKYGEGLKKHLRLH